MRDAQDPARRGKLLVGDSCKRPGRSAGRYRQPLIVLNERKRNIGAQQLDLRHLANRYPAGAEGLERDRSAIPVQQRGVDIPVVPRIADLLALSS